MIFPKTEIIEELKKKYPIGSRIRLIYMYDPYTNIPKGTLGTVRNIDDIGTIHVNWDTGHNLGLAYDVDDYEPYMEGKDVEK